MRNYNNIASRWRSPLIVAILAGAVAALGNAVVAYTNNVEQRKLDAQQSEEARILEMIKTGSPDKAAANLRFLLQAGLINDGSVRRQLTIFLSKRKPGSGPSLPSSVPSGAASIVSRFEGIRDHAYRDPSNRLTIGSTHLLTAKEQSTGILVIGGKRVPWRQGITPAQAQALLTQDLEPTRRVVDSLVKVRLTRNQRDALTDFVFNLGAGNFRSSLLLRELNAGHYDQVPAEMLKWVKVGNVVLPGLAARRRAEVALWNKP